MRDEEDGLPKALPDAQEPILESATSQSIEGPKGFIQQHDISMTRHRAEQSSPLFHSPRQGDRITILKTRKPKKWQEFARFTTSFPPIHPRQFGAQDDVVENAAPGE